MPLIKTESNCDRDYERSMTQNWRGMNRSMTHIYISPCADYERQVSYKRQV